MGLFIYRFFNFSLFLIKKIGIILKFRRLTINEFKYDPQLGDYINSPKHFRISPHHLYERFHLHLHLVFAGEHMFLVPE